MSYELNDERERVAFDMTTGEETEFEPEACTCVLDIHSNLAMNMANFGLDTVRDEGNFSQWVPVDASEGVMVSGLTSCGAIFYANHDFSRIAAGHMSGDSRFVEAWCKALETAKIKPHFLLFGTGPSGSRSIGGQVLMQYMTRFSIPPSRAQAVAACGAIFLTRSQLGQVFASADVELQCKRTGQAVRKRRALPPEVEQRAKFENLTIYDEPNLTNAYLLVSVLSTSAGVTWTFTTDQQEMKTRMAENGKKIIQAYLKTLPTSLKTAFLEFKLFTMYPDWKA